MHTAKLFQNGEVVASRSSPDEWTLFRDMAALVTACEADGPVEIRMDGKVWKPMPRIERSLP